jgi:hypothetical protein
VTEGATALLALLGRAAPRLLLWPGVLGLPLLALLLLRARARGPIVLSGEGLLACAMPLLALALLPLPGAAPLDHEIDVLVALGLLECPRWLGAALLLRERAIAQAAWLIAAALNAYPALALAALVLSAPAGILRLSALPAAPSIPAALAACAWALALSGLLRSPLVARYSLVAAGHALSTLGQLALALLLLIRALPLDGGRPSGWLVAALLLGLLLVLGLGLRRALGARLEAALCLLLALGLLAQALGLPS